VGGKPYAAEPAASAAAAAAAMIVSLVIWNPSSRLNEVCGRRPDPGAGNQPAAAACGSVAVSVERIGHDCAATCHAVAVRAGCGARVVVGMRADARDAAGSRDRTSVRPGYGDRARAGAAGAAAAGAAVVGAAPGRDGAGADPGVCLGYAGRGQGGCE